MNYFDLAAIDRRKFLRGTAGFALSIPCFESALGSEQINLPENPKRLACFYMPDGVPMPLPEDPAYEDWSWFPHGEGKDFQFTKCLEPLQSIRENVSILAGLSHPSGRDIHGHSNADQFLTGATTTLPGQPNGPYQNSISIDQELAKAIGEHTRVSSLVLSTDGGTGSPRGAQTMSFDRNGRPIPAESKPKRIFDLLFVKDSADASRRIAVSESVLDDLLSDAKSFSRQLSTKDKRKLDEYLHAVRDAELNVQKAKRWLDIPYPSVDRDHLQLEISPEDPRNFLRTMYELIYLAFRTDTTRIATYQLGRENAIGVSDYLGRAVGFNLTHQLTHATKEPGGWKNFGTYCRFLSEEYGRFLKKLESTPEENGSGSMLDNTVLLFGSASSAFHLSRNYPLILAGGKNLGFQHGRYLDYGKYAQGINPAGGPWLGGQEPWQKEMNYEELPLSNLYVSMLQRLGLDIDQFADSTGPLAGI